MQLSGMEDIDAPIADVFEVVSDFSSFERSAIRRGIDVQRANGQSEEGVGLAWNLKVPFRGKTREAQLSLTEYEPMTALGLLGSGNGIEADTKIELLALSPRRTRISVSVKLHPKTLSGRLMLQSLKLVRSKVRDRFKLRLGEFARMTEERLLRAT